MRHTGLNPRLPRWLLVPLVVFGKHSIESILQDAQFHGLPRNLDLVELWSGTEALTRAARSRRLRAEPFDILRSPGEDITNESGFRKALGLVMRLREGGLLWQGVLCSSFVFANSKLHGRRRGSPEGDATYPPVAVGNLMADIAALFLLLCLKRGVDCAIENPAGSQLFSYIKPSLRAVWRGLYIQTCHRCAYDRSNYPRIGPKAFKFLATRGWIKLVNHKCTCPDPTNGQPKHQ